MYCKKCGQEINDDAVVCIHCGVSTENSKTEHNDSKTGLGIVLALFLGIIGLIIGICMYPSGTVARKTFLKAWGITFGIEVGVTILLYVIMATTIVNIIF